MDTILGRVGDFAFRVRYKILRFSVLSYIVFSLFSDCLNFHCYKLKLPSAAGLVRSSLLTTVIQVFSRLLLVWGVVNAYPQATSPSPFYSSMLVAWSFTEIVRYSYFVLNLRGEVPGFMTWLRYNAFYPLYPIGIGSEVILIWKASALAEKGIQWALLGLLLAYIPGKSDPVRIVREVLNHTVL